METASLELIVDNISDFQLVEAVCKLFSRCSHRQQVQLMDNRLPIFLKRDFLTLLPPELVIRILSFLEEGDIFKCLLVSRNWNIVITNCEPFWKYYTKRLGVSPLVMSAEIRNYTSYKALALAMLRLKNVIHHAKPVLLDYLDKTGKPPKATLTCRPAKPVWNGLFIGHEVYASCDVGTYVLSIRAIDQKENLVELTAVTVSHLFVIIWSQSSLKHILIHGSDGSWIQTRIFHREGFDVCNTMWTDSVYSGAYYEMGCCPDCCLVGIVSKALQEQELWSLLMNRLVVGYEKPWKLHNMFSFMPFESCYRNVFFQIHKLVVLSNSSDCDKDGFCTEHKLLLQFGACICMFSLEIETMQDGTENMIVQNLYNLCPFNDHSYYTTPSILGHEFCLSEDGKLAAYFVDGSFFTWNLDTCKLYGFKRDGYQFPANADCIAVGSLFSIMYTNGMHGLRVVSTVTGDTLLFHRIDYPGDNPVHGPKDQQWLNSLHGNQKRLSLAINVREWQNPGMLVFKSPTAL